MQAAAKLRRKARFFEWYAKYLWPWRRWFARKYLSQRCQRCSVSERYAPLDDAGICRECRQYGQQNGTAQDAEAGRAQLEAELRELLVDYQGRGKNRYDAVVMLSGGKDSAFLLYELKRIYPGLRLLSLTIDNGYLSAVALENARKTVTTLDIDHVVLRPAMSLYTKTFRYACTHLEPGKGCFEVVDRMDADLGFALAKNYAAENHVPLLISGLSWIQMERLFQTKSYEVPPSIALRANEESAGHLLGQIYDQRELDYWWDPAKHSSDSLPRMIMPFYVWRHDESMLRQKVRELGLIDTGNDSPLVTNAIVIPMMILVDYLHLGYASFEPEFAQMVREGKADRRFWKHVFEMLEYAAKSGWMLDREAGEIASSLNLTMADIGLARNSAR